MPEQLTETLSIEIKIFYYKLLQVNATPEFTNPSKPYEDTSMSITVDQSNLDRNGIYRFKDPDDSSKPLSFVASAIQLRQTSGPDLLNLDFVGTLYDFETAVDGKHGDGKTDRWNTLEIGQFVTKEDGTEVIKVSEDYNKAKDVCRAHCTPSLKTATKAFAGIKLVDTKKYKCKCFSQGLSDVVGKPANGFTGRSDPRISLDCSTPIDTYKAQFNADTALINFLKATSGLSVARTTTTTTTTTLAPATGSGAAPATTPPQSNVCQKSQDVAAMYLAQVLGLDVGNIISTYVYDPEKTQTFPTSSSTPTPTFIPSNGDDTKKAFWTIMNQYSSATEASLRAGKDRTWCHYAGLGMYQHCLTQAVKCADSAGCKANWEIFLKTCHQVRSMDPMDTKYIARNNNPRFWCLSSVPAEQVPPVVLYWVYSTWTRACPHLEDRIYSMADSSQGPTGWLELKSPNTGFDRKYRIPGTSMKYKCSRGFDLANDTNPEQVLTCQASRLVDLSNVAQCKGE